MEIKLIQDLEEAKKMWQLLSPQESIYDLWDLRFCFYQYDKRPLYFYVAYEKGEAVALLPLQYIEEKNFLEFFAENFTESNRPFVKAGYEYLIPELFAAPKLPLKIFDLLGVDSFIKQLPLEDYVYFFDVSDCKNFNDYLLKAFPSGKKRYNFNRLFNILERNHRVEVIYDDFSDLDLLMDLNVKNFGDDSYLRPGVERQPFYDLLKLPWEWKMVTIVVDGRKLASSLSVIYNNVYFYLIVGLDISEVPDVFKYLTKVNLELAINSQLKIFNCALGDCGWKQNWHLEREPQYQYERK